MGPVNASKCHAVLSRQSLRGAYATMCVCVKCVLADSELCIVLYQVELTYLENKKRVEGQILSEE